jgi:pyrimidine operon attenuation protein/uracil phosphoribosyltransferase
MKVIFFCGYYPDRAHNKKRRTEDYWNAYFYVWAVKFGTHKKDFYILNPERLNITKRNFDLVRKNFGKWASGQIPKLSGEDLVLVPIPSKDALVGRATYRSLQMAVETFKDTPYANCVLDGLRWKKDITKAHEGGARSRAILLPLLEASPQIKGKKIILVDELFSTGGSLLASSDCLIAAGAEVLGAITCGKTIYDFETPPFGTAEFNLTTELADWQG